MKGWSTMTTDTKDEVEDDIEDNDKDEEVE